MVIHGFCEDDAEATERAFKSGLDIDMCANAYAKHLVQAVQEGRIEETLVDEAVWRVLCLKNKLGLFEEPYRAADQKMEETVLLCKAHRELAREAVRESLVLLKNEAVDGRSLLPLAQKEIVAFIGPYIDGQDMNSSWAVTGNPDDGISVMQAAQNVFSKDQVFFGQGCTLLDNRTYLKKCTMKWMIGSHRIRFFYKTQ